MRHEKGFASTHLRMFASTLDGRCRNRLNSSEFIRILNKLSTSIKDNNAIGCKKEKQNSKKVITINYLKVDLILSDTGQAKSFVLDNNLVN